MSEERARRRAGQWALAACGAVLVAASAACGTGETTASESSSGSGGGEAASAAMPHGDHTPRHGGLVLMHGDLHFEVVLDASGAYRVYFSDAVRNELPASVASDVTVTVMRPGEPPETVALNIDDRDESWIARGQPVGAAATTTARVSYAYHGQTYWIDVPFEYTGVADPHAGQQR